MRAPALALVLLVPALAGCLAADVPSAAVQPAALALPSAPAGARVETLPDGLRLLWDAVDLPFETTFEVPAGTTVVRATTKLAAAEVPFVVLLDDATGRRRCQTPVVESWSTDLLGERTCVGLAAIDPLPARWKVVARGSTDVAELVAVEFLTVPLEGPAASLDLSQLSMPEFALLDTEVVEVESFDGTLLHVEVTRPDTDAPVPAVVISSPYNAETRAAGQRPQDSTIRDWVARGYAIVSADVRGYGESGGCVEVWSANEQKDQAALVEWTAAQPWSDGNVGFYGQSYVGTTPVAAAVQAPEALKAIVTVAPVIDAYWDWHFGGVPNGENLGSPVGYQQIGMEAETETSDPLTTAMNVGNGFCDPTLLARANDPRAVYDAFYEERNFSARAGDVKAAVLYTQGFEDRNVKSRMVSDWFNALPGEKLGLFGHWVHQHPPRADQEVLFLGWFDQHLKGKPVGFERLADAYVLAQDGTERAVEAWPPTDAAEVVLYADLAGRQLAAEPPAEGEATIVLDEAGRGPFTVADQGKPELPNSVLSLEGEVAEAWRLAGTGGVRLAGHLPLGGNAHVAAFLWEGDKLVTWGMFNLAHRDGHDAYAPLAAREDFDVFLPFLPIEHAFTPGKELRLDVRASRTADWFLTQPSGGVALTLHGGPEGTALVLPTVDASAARATSPAFLFG